jgi:hypothetical protein
MKRERRPRGLAEHPGVPEVLAPACNFGVVDSPRRDAAENIKKKT